jgi:hypothetical protein
MRRCVATFHRKRGAAGFCNIILSVCDHGSQEVPAGFRKMEDNVEGILSICRSSCFSSFILQFVRKVRTVTGLLAGHLYVSALYSIYCGNESVPSLSSDAVRSVNITSLLYSVLPVFIPRWEIEHTVRLHRAWRIVIRKGDVLEPGPPRWEAGD